MRAHVCVCVRVCVCALFMCLVGLWIKQPNNPALPAFTADPGLKVPLPDDPVPYDFAKLFYTDDFWQYLVEETNRYATQYLDKEGEGLPPSSRARQWVPVTVPEMKVFLSLSLLMGIIVKPEIDQYWSRNALLYTPIFSSSISRDRWMLIMEFLHFADNSQPQHNDKLAKIRPLITFMNNRFQEVYVPDQNISIDEELIAWRGRLQFRQYIPSKRARFGIKIFALCETSGYMTNFIVYTGKDNNTFPQDLIKEVGKSGAVVVKLMEPYLDKGYHLYIDNWYTSLELAKHLQAKQTRICGTIRKNRKGLPKRIINKKVSKGEFVHRSTNDGILFVKLEDTKTVHFLSNIHSAEVIATGKRDRQGHLIKKLGLVHQYNRHMGGVDRNDEMMSFYTAARKTLKWYKKLATHVIEEGLLNAYILYKKNGGKKLHTDFLVLALEGMLEDGKRGLESARTAAPATPNRTSLGHQPALIPPTEHKAKPQKRCRVCWSKGTRKESRYHCPKCPGTPGLCAAPCFAQYKHV